MQPSSHPSPTSLYPSTCPPLRPPPLPPSTCAVIEYKTLVLRGDPDAADALLPQIPKNQLDSVARFLESRGSVEVRRADCPSPERWNHQSHRSVELPCWTSEGDSGRPVSIHSLFTPPRLAPLFLHAPLPIRPTQKAFEVASDTDLKFDLAIRLGRLRDAMGLAEGEEGAEQRWQQIGDLALKTGAFDIAEEALKKAGDLAALLMLYSANGDASGARWLATAAVEKGLDNVAFMGALLAGDVGSCVDVLEGANRFPEAALFARTYAPSRVSGAVKAWREDLG